MWKLGWFSRASDSEIPFRENFPRQLNCSCCSLPASTAGRHFLVLTSKCYSTSSLNFLFWCYIGYLHKTEELSQILLLPLQSYWPPRSWTGVNEGRIWRNRVVQCNYISTVQYHQVAAVVSGQAQGKFGLSTTVRHLLDHSWFMPF